MSDQADHVGGYDLCPRCEYTWERCACGYCDQEKPDSDYCKLCGKDRYDFSYLGCSACDARHPNFGVVL